jgi:hypothetical protein
MVIIAYFLIIGILLGVLSRLIGAELLKYSALLKHIKNKLSNLIAGKDGKY